MAGQKDRTGGGIASFRVGFGEEDAPEEKARGDFRILVVGGLTASADFASRPSGPRGPVKVSAATFDEVMTELDPSLAVEVPDPSRPQGKPLRVELSFARLRSFRPDTLMQEVEAFRALGGDNATPEPPRAQTSPGVAPAPGGASLLEDILAGMAGPSRTPSERPALAKSEHTSALLRSILGHPEVRRLERTWRGLKLLVDRAGDRGVTIMVVSAGIDEVDDALARSSRLAEGGGIDLVVVDYELGAQARDLQRAERWASRAEAIPAPLLTNALPEVLGFDDLEKLARTHRRVRSVEGPRAVAFRALTQKDCTRWLLLAMNGVLLRQAHASGEALDGGAAWVVAVAAARAFVGCGWACALTEPEYRAVPDLNVHMVEDRGATISIATNSPVSSEVAGEAAAAGVTVLTFMRDQDVAVLPFAQMVYRGPAGAAGFPAAAEVTLADQLFLARIVPLITEIAAAIPRDSDDAAARDTARIALLSLFSADAGQAPVVQVALIREPAILEVTIRPCGFRGVRMPEVTLRAPLGE